MINAFLALLFCQLVGEVANRIGFLPFPGPVTGMGLLFAFLYWRGRTQASGTPNVPADLAGVCDGLLRHLSLLYVPAATGIVDRLGLLAAHPLAIGGAIVVSTILTQAVTGLAFDRLAARRRPTGVAPSGQLP